jgi:enterochelin esterase-like enzyme
MAALFACRPDASIDPVPSPLLPATPTLRDTLLLPTLYPTSRPSATASLPETTPPSVSIPTPIQTPAVCSGSGEVILGNYGSQLTGQVHNYRIYLPPCYGRDGHVYPVLYVFHGSAQNDSHWDDIGLDEAAEQSILAGRIPPLVIVMPDGGQIAQNTSGGPGSFEQLILADLIPHIETNYCVSAAADGRAIGGLSRGGYWAMEIAFRNPSEFGAVAGHSAALLDVAAGPSVDPQMTALTNDLGKLRIYLDIGKDDWVLNNTLRLHEEMLDAGVLHTWLFNDGGHNDTYWSAHVAEYLAWYSEAWPFARDQYPPCQASNE